jgi:hypothetical protein
VPRIVIIPSPRFELATDVRVVGEALEHHLETIIAIDDEWRDLIASGDDADLMLKLKMYILDAVSGCKTGFGNICHAAVLHRSDIVLVWLDEDGATRFISVKDVVRRRELLYAYPAEEPEGVRLLRLQTFKPLEPRHRLFFSEQFEILELELYEMLHGNRDLERWRRLAGAGTLPSIVEAVAGAARRFVEELCFFGDYNLCPGILLLSGEDRVDVKILKITSKPDYVARIDLAGLLSSR